MNSEPPPEVTAEAAPPSGAAVIHSSPAFTACRFEKPQPGTLTLFSDGQIQFVCAAPQKSATFNCSDIQMANFAKSGSGSAIFTVNDGTKYQFLFAPMNSPIGIPQTIRESLVWQDILAQHLPPEKIKKGSVGRFVMMLAGIFPCIAAAFVGLISVVEAADKPKTQAIAAYRQGVTHEREQHFEQALADYQRAAELKPDLYEAKLNAGAMLIKLNRPKEALEFFTQARSLRANDPTIHQNLGIALSMLNRLEEAEAELNQSIRLGGGDAGAWYRRGLLKQLRAGWKAALPDFEEAARLQPQEAEYVFYCALAQGNLGRQVEALTLLDRAIQLRPRDARLHYFRGVDLWFLNRPDEAAKAIDTALEIDPTNKDALAQRARMRGQGGPR
jgi:tetratricopeptide (TPR) repeat protein